MDTYTISVVIPSYNRSGTIERCLQSVLNQTYRPYEIIVIDDGSTDKTISIIEKLDSDLITIIRQNHKGAQAARNIGILNAKGEYITFLDSDDEWVATKLEKQIAVLKGNEDKVIYCDCYIMDDVTHRKKVWRLPTTNGDMYKFLLMYQGPMYQGMLVRRASLLKMGLLDESVVSYQEWETSIRLARNNKFIHMKEPLFLYHYHGEETISKDIKKGMYGYEYIVNKYKKEILKKCGIKSLRKHYKIIINYCLKLKDIRVISYIVKWILGI